MLNLIIYCHWIPVAGRQHVTGQYSCLHALLLGFPDTSSWQLWETECWIQWSDLEVLFFWSCWCYKSLTQQESNRKYLLSVLASVLANVSIEDLDEVENMFIRCANETQQTLHTFQKVNLFIAVGLMLNTGSGSRICHSVYQQEIHQTCLGDFMLLNMDIYSISNSW